MESSVEHVLLESRAAEAQGDFAAALAAAARAHQLADNAQDDVGRCAALAHQAYLYVRMGRIERATVLAEAALQADDRSQGSVQAYLALGMCAGYTNALDRAETLFHQAADLSREIGDTTGRIHALHFLASIVYSLRGRFDLALATSAESHRLSHSIGRKDWGYPMIRAEIYRMQGDRAGTRVALAELAAVAEPGSLYDGIRRCYTARLALDEDDTDQAAQELPAARAIGEAIGSPILAVWTRVETARWARLQGDIPAALGWADDALVQAQRSRFAYLEVLARVEQARCMWAAGDVTTAQSALEAIMQLTDAVGLHFERARSAFYLAVLVAQRELPQAAELWCAAVDRIVQGGYGFLVERERLLAFPLLNQYLRGDHKEARAAAETVLKLMDDVAPLPLHITGLGGFHVRVGRRGTAERYWQRRKAGELLRFLLLQRRRDASQSAVLDALWPDHSPKSAQAQLHQATSTLRRLLEPDLPDRFPSRYLVHSGERLALHLPPGSTVDFEEFEARLSTASSVDELENALALYVDDLFPQDLYADWAAPRRERLAQLYLRGLLSLARLYTAQDLPHKALDCCRQVLERDPWSEDAVLVGMHAHLALNNRPGALRLYRTLERTLVNELGLEPREDLQALVASLPRA